MTAERPSLMEFRGKWPERARCAVAGHDWGYFEGVPQGEWWVCWRCDAVEFHEQHLFGWEPLGWAFRLVGNLRGEWYWKHDRRGAYALARLLCGVFGHTKNVSEGGDCRRCWS